MLVPPNLVRQQMKRSIARLFLRSSQSPQIPASGFALGRFFQILQHFFGVAVGLDLFEDVLDFSLRANDEGCAGDAHHFFAVHVLFLQNTIGYGDLLFGIGQQGKRQFLLVGEFFLGRRSIRGYAKQHGAGLLNLFI
jgi:hypothetical protein